MRAFVRRVLLPVARFLFGELHWSPPPWLRLLLAPFAALARQAERFRREQPRRFWTTAAVIAVLLCGGYGGWRWWQGRPKPHFLTWSTTLPAPTALEPEAKPRPFVVRFSGSAAPLEQIGKAVSRGLRVKPELAGAWTWASDTELVFSPAVDWEVGREYEVHFEPSFFGPQVRLESYDLSFTSPSFAASVDECVFHEDPTDPKKKEVVATVRFSHPVDRADFEKRVRLKLRVEPTANFDERDVKTFGFTVSYDDVGGKAYVHSAPVAIPERDGEMLFAVAAGARSARGGPGIKSDVERSVHIPGIENYFRVLQAEAEVVTNANHEAERVLVLNFSAGVRQADLAKAVTVQLLPKDRPAIGDRPAEADYPWQSEREIVPEVLALATPVELEWLPTEREFSDVQSARFKAATGAYVIAKVARGLRSFGDYPLARDRAFLLRAEEYPQEVRILHDGSLLSLSGERQLSILARNVPAVRFELSRLLPGSVALLLSQSERDSRFQKPKFDYWKDFGLDDISERFTDVRPLPPVDPGRQQYTTFDFTRFLRDGAAPRGLFSLEVAGWDAAAEEKIPEVADRRLVLITDLGILAKKARDDTYEVFVQSIRSGEPVAGARVDVLGRNGMPVLSEAADADGRVRFPRLDDFKREKKPVAFVAQTEGDFTFLPYDRYDRRVDLSRFDIGGLYTDAQQEGLQAYLFSDRGVYRPGEEIHIGMIVKRLDWQRLADALPLQIVVVDPRGLEIRREMVKFAADGFESFSITPQENAPTGAYQFNLYVVRDRDSDVLLASTRARVEEFQPDRLTLKADLTAAPRKGWISPADLRCHALLRNLFGTPVDGGKVHGSLQLSASLPAFPEYADYHFHDPAEAKKSYDETLDETTTNAGGEADLDLGLGRFEHATYRMRVSLEGFAAEGGRSVSASTAAIVSPLEHLVGWKADGDLGYVHRDSRRTVELIAIDPDLALVGLDGLEAELLEVNYVSVLTKQENGTYAYQSVRREISRRKDPLSIPTAGLRLPLPTDAPGSFVIAVRDGQGTELNRIAFEIVGEGNVSRSLERSAELRVKLGKADYAPGEEIELAVQSPYVGAGLITIERDRVYASKWFVSEGNSTVQTIRLPEDLEGNGYVVVSFVRSLASAEIYTSPLSSGVAPFTVSRERHTQRIGLDVPSLVRPGQELRIGYETGTPARIALFAVDEGILQVARYQTPAPLDSFFRKRALEVSTSQILDLILPEISLVQSLAAPGGDDDSLQLGLRNPFKRKGLPPVAYWSGIFSSDGTPGAVTYRVPDHFNGTIRVLAVAVGEGTIGVSEKRTVARSAFVLQPTLPYFASPGDEFELSSLVANTLEPDAKVAGPIAVTLEASEALAVVGGATKEMDIAPGKDATAVFKLRAGNRLGVASLTLRARAGGEESKVSLELSLRPASAFVTSVSGGAAERARDGAELALTRRLYPEERDVEASAAQSPLAFARGMSQYLEHFPYGCTEQVVSQAFAAVVLASQPELGHAAKAEDHVAHTVATLQARQDADGAFGVWSAATPEVPLFTAYATHFLVEARERGLSMPASLFDRALEHARDEARRKDRRTLEALRAQAYSLYLVARNGTVTTAALNDLRQQLDREQKAAWHADLTALFVASTYKMLQLDREADEVLDAAPPLAARPRARDEETYGELLYRAYDLYLLSRHFPERAPKLRGDDLLAITDEVSQGRFNTFSASLSILALDAYTRTATTLAPAPTLKIEALNADGSARPLALEGTIFRHADVPSTAARVRYSGEGRERLFYQLVEAGYDAAMPTEVWHRGIEAFRELRGADGAAIERAGVTDRVEAHVVVRSLDESSHQIAVVDLLPGGFEIDMAPGGIVDRQSLSRGADTWVPEYIEVREDRVVFYGWATPQAKHFAYRIKPMSRGTYAVPPLYAEGLYDRAVVARSLGGRFVVE